jgi:hypothetical protein
MDDTPQPAVARRIGLILDAEDAELLALVECHEKLSTSDVIRRLIRDAAKRISTLDSTGNGGTKNGVAG